MKIEVVYCAVIIKHDLITHATLRYFLNFTKDNIISKFIILFKKKQYQQLNTMQRFLFEII